jgi:hypothetical protein
MHFPYLLKATLLVALVLLAVIPNWAGTIPVRGGSTYGDDKGLLGCQNEITNFVNDPNFPNGTADNCEGFEATTFLIGGNTYKGALFAFLEPGGTAFGTLDIIQLAANASLTLNLVNPGLPTGLFMCGSFDQGNVDVAQDSSVPPTDLTGLPCTAGSSSTAYFNAAQDVPNVQANFSATGVTFVNDTSDAIAVYAQDGNIAGTATTPEPSSLVLLGLGALAIGRKFRRAS